MPPTPTTQEMGEKHERHVAEALGGARTRGSGNGVDKGDGATHHDLPFAFRWDCKSTKGKQIALTAQMIEKIIEQAGGERPAIPLRWYGNEMLTKVLHDWIAVTLADFTELLADATDWAELLRHLALARHASAGPAGAAEVADIVLSWRRRMRQAEEEITGLQAAKKSLEAYNEQAGEIIRRQRQELEAAPPPAGPPQVVLPVPEFVPALPWTVVHQVHEPGTVKNAGVYYDPNGMQTTVEVRSVRVERSLGPSNRPRLIVNDTRVKEGALYVDGHVRTVVSERDPSVERG